MEESKKQDPLVAVPPLCKRGARGDLRQVEFAQFLLMFTQFATDMPSYRRRPVSSKTKMHFVETHWIPAYAGMTWRYFRFLNFFLADVALS